MGTAANGWECMPAYRLYCLDGVGKIINAHWIAADDDDQAIKLADDKVRTGLKCELWERDRLIKRFGLLA